MASSATHTQQLLQPLVAHARDMGFDLPDGFGSPARLSHAMWSDHSPLAVRLTVQEDARRLGVMPWVRTSSWNFDGERTDLHDVTALSYALDLHSAFGLSASFIPEGGFCPSEMYSVTLLPTQPVWAGVPLTAGGVQTAGCLLKAALRCWEPVRVCSHPLHPGGGGEPWDTGYSYEQAEPWAAAVRSGIGPDADGQPFTCSRRLCPNWWCFYQERTGVVVLRMARFADFWRSELANYKFEAVDGIRGRMVLAGDLRHFISFRATRRAAAILRAVGEAVPSARDLPAVAVENRVVFFGREHVVALFGGSGRAAFEKERDRVRGRFEAESSLLFPAATFDWASPVPDADFESLVCELLDREPGGVRCRRAGPTREPDDKRDLIAEWRVPPTGPAADDAPPARPVPVVVQCKAYRESVGKADVTDLRDTVEHHGAAGYFLATSSELSGRLIAQLERLRRHPDITTRYPQVVRPK